MIDVVTNLNTLIQRIRVAEQTYHRASNSVSLLAVSKSHGSALIEKLFDAGQQNFAENYLQEALHKVSALAHKQLIWHFIGAIQSNKAALIAQNFSWVHTVSHLSQAQKLSANRPEQLGPLNICIQVKLDNNPNRAGTPIDEVPALIIAIKQLPLLSLRGLMTLPPLSKDFAQQRHYFNLVKNLFSQVNDGSLDTLSMGMTQDFEAAIAEGATMVRIGTALFSPRTK